MHLRPRRPTLRDLRRPTVIALAAANAVPLVGVAFLGWDLGAIMLLFWLESVVIGLWHAAKLALVAQGLALGAVVFFALHYGMFTLVHGFFVFALFLGDGPGVGVGMLATALLAMVASHGYSFVKNFVRGGEVDRWRERPEGVKELIGTAYGRVIVMHLTIIGGGFLMMSLGAPEWAILVLVVLKTGIDAGAHLAQRDEAEAQASSGIR